MKLALNSDAPVILSSGRFAATFSPQGEKGA